LKSIRNIIKCKLWVHESCITLGFKHSALTTEERGGWCDGGDGGGAKVGVRASVRGEERERDREGEGRERERIRVWGLGVVKYEGERK